jgi:uncharacterized membrane protein YfcA
MFSISSSGLDSSLMNHTLSSIILSNNTFTEQGFLLSKWFQDATDDVIDSNKDMGEEVFVKTPLRFPPTYTEACGLFVLFLIGILATAGGLGAGGILIPFVMIFFKLPLFECVPIANVFGLISSTTRFIVNYR